MANAGCQHKRIHFQARALQMSKDSRNGLCPTWWGHSKAGRRRLLHISLFMKGKVWRDGCGRLHFYNG